MSDLLDQQEEDVALARDILFKQMVCTYENTCETLGVSKEMSSILRLKDRRGENACNARAEDVIDIYAFNCGLVKDIPRNVLSANSRLLNLSEMQDTSCNNQRYMKMYAELKAKVCEMQIQLADLETYKCEIENIQLCSDIVRQLESRVLKLERENMYLKNRVTLLLRDGQFNSNNEGDPTISNDTIVTNDQVESSICQKHPS